MLPAMDDPTYPQTDQDQDILTQRQNTRMPGDQASATVSLDVSWLRQEVCYKLFGLSDDAVPVSDKTIPASRHSITTRVHPSAVGMEDLIRQALADTTTPAAVTATIKEQVQHEVSSMLREHVQKRFGDLRAGVKYGGAYPSNDNKTWEQTHARVEQLYKMEGTVERILNDCLKTLADGLLSGVKETK